MNQLCIYYKQVRGGKEMADNDKKEQKQNSFVFPGHY